MNSTLAMLLFSAGCADPAMDPPSLMVEAKLDADFGDLESAACRFDAVAGHSETPEALRWEASVRLAQTYGRLERNTEQLRTYRSTFERYRHDSDAVRFLTLAVAGVAPARSRWEAMWREVALVASSEAPAVPIIQWPGFESSVDGDGTPISIHVEDASIRDVVRQLSNQADFSYTVDRDAVGTLSASIENVPWERALRLAVLAAGVQLHSDGRVERIVPANANRHLSLAFDTDSDNDSVALDLYGVGLGDVLRLFADVSGLNIVVLPGVRGNVDLKLDSRPWDHALVYVLDTQGLASSRRGEVLVIAEPERLAPFVAMETKDYRGEIVDIDFQSAGLEEIAGFFGNTTGRELVTNGSFEGRLTLKLSGVRSDHAVDIIGALKEVRMSLW